MHGMRALVALTLTSAIGLFALMQTEVFGMLAEGLGVRIGRIDLDVASRLNMALMAWEAFREHPILGTGAGRFADLGGNLLQEEAFYPHNLFLELGAEFGIVAVILVAWLLWKAVRSFWTLRHIDRAAAAIGLASLLFLLVTAMKMGDISMHRLMYLWIGIAIAISVRVFRQAQASSSAMAPACNATTSSAPRASLVYGHRR
jgi:O-antigen ligase